MVGVLPADFRACPRQRPNEQGGEENPRPRPVGRGVRKEEKKWAKSCLGTTHAQTRKKPEGDRRAKARKRRKKRPGALAAVSTSVRSTLYRMEPTSQRSDKRKMDGTWEGRTTAEVIWGRKRKTLCLDVIKQRGGADRQGDHQKEKRGKKERTTTIPLGKLGRGSASSGGLTNKAGERGHRWEAQRNRSTTEKGERASLPYQPISRTRRPAKKKRGLWVNGNEFGPESHMMEREKDSYAM